jgi:hypothetical protein
MLNQNLEQMTSAQPLIINDNKNLANYISFKFTLFLNLYKITELNSKNELVEILSSRPASPVTGLQKLVSRLKKIDNQWSNKLTEKKIIKTSKKIQTNKTNDVNEIYRLLMVYENMQPVQPTGLNLLKSKVQNIKDSLITNKLPWPINMLVPLKSTQNKFINPYTGQNIKLLNYEKPVTTDLLNNLNHPNHTKYLQLINGHKIINKYQQSIRFNFSNMYNIKIENIITLLEYSFRSMSCLISKPVFLETPNSLIINLFYYFIPGTINKIKRFKRLKKYGLLNKPKSSAASLFWGAGKKISKKAARKKYNILKSRFSARVFFSPKNLEKMEILTTVLSRIFNKQIIFDLIPLKSPLFDDNILVNAIGIICNRLPVRYLFNFIFRKAILYSKVRANLKYRYSTTKSYLSGIRIKIGGRLMTQRVVPRISTREKQLGPVSHRKVSFVDWSRVVLKNRRGAHSISITMSHVF